MQEQSKDHHHDRNVSVTCQIVEFQPHLLKLRPAREPKARAAPPCYVIRAQIDSSCTLQPALTKYKIREPGGHRKGASHSNWQLAPATSCFVCCLSSLSISHERSSDQRAGHCAALLCAALRCWTLLLPLAISYFQLLSSVLIFLIQHIYYISTYLNYQLQDILNTTNIFHSLPAAHLLVYYTICSHSLFFS